MKRRADSSLCTQNAIDVVQDPRIEAAHELVARIRSRREPAVDDRRLDPAPPALAQQVRPDLGLHHHEEPRPDEIERAADEDAEVERESRRRPSTSCMCRRAIAARPASSSTDRMRRLRVARAQIARERPRGQHFADRHGVNPDRRLRVHVERHGQVAHALGQAADVLPVSQRLIQEPGRDDERETPAPERCKGNT